MVQSRHLDPQLAGRLNELLRFCKRRGASYADARFQETTHEQLVVENGALDTCAVTISAGMGLRVIVDGSWGFAASALLTPAALQRAAQVALAAAKASSRINRTPVTLAPVAPARGQFRGPCVIDPFTVPLSSKLEYLLWACDVLHRHRLIKTAIATLDFYRIRKRFVSTEGSDIAQEFIESGGHLEAIASAHDEVQVRSYPASHRSALAQAGYEYVKAIDLVGGAERTRHEAVALLSAKELRGGELTVILDSSQMALQIHESCGHPVELDRVLGTELSFAGGSFLTPDKRGHFQYGSPLVSIVADATVPGGLGTMFFDDEGVSAQQHDIIRNGTFVGYLSSRETAPRVGLAESSGAMRAEDWDVPPLIRMTNINLEPGDGSLAQLLKDTKRGVYLGTNKSWSIDDQRLNFQFSTEIGWEIRKGKLGAMIKNPIYTGITPLFWRQCTAVAGPTEWKLWGLPNCGKGEPGQSMHVGHGASPARFANVRVGRGT